MARHPGRVQYVPFLKLKPAEKQAVASLSDDLLGAMTPLFEIVERKDKPLEQHLKTAFKGFAPAAQRLKRYYLDAREILADAPLGARRAFELAGGISSTFVPVTGLRRADAADALQASDGRGIALRLTRDDFEQDYVGKGLERFRAKHRLEPKNVDLILDLGLGEDMIAEGIATLALQFLADIPSPNEWRTLTLHSSAFPFSMSVVSSNSWSLVERTDWIVWRDFLHAARKSLPRLPAYSDMAIQHPKGVEGFNPQVMHTAAAIRYATPEHWLLVKGRSTRDEPERAQFPKLAAQLVRGPLSEHFMGRAHCRGCERIDGSAAGRERLVTLQVWRTIGTIHHLTLTVAALRDLPAP